MSEMAERVARAILVECKRQATADHEASRPPYVDDDGWPEHQLLDGHFDLVGVGRAAIEAMREPTPDMTQAESYVSGLWSRRNIEAFIDEALK